LPKREMFLKDVGKDEHLWGGLGRGEYHPHLTSPIKGEGLKEKLFQKLNTSFLIYVNKLS